MPPKKRKKAVKKRAPSRKKQGLKKGKKPPLKRKTIIRKPAKPKIKENIIGIVTHYFPHVNAAVIKLKKPLSNGDHIKIKGHTTDFTQVIDSMQIDHVPVNSAKKGQEIGLLVSSRVRQHDVVTKA